MSKVQIFKDRIEYDMREDKSVNGVTQEFLDFQGLLLDDIILVDCIGCWECNDCMKCEKCWECKFCVNCESCYHCINCKDCIGCLLCKDCDVCKICEKCMGCEHIENYRSYINDNGFLEYKKNRGR